MIIALVALVVTGAVIVRADPAPRLGSAPAPPPAPPASLDDLPLGPATRVPWWQDGTLHVGDATIETPLDLLLYGNGTTVVGRAHFDRGSEWFVVRDSTLEPLVASPGLVTTEVSADGGTIIWSDAVAEDRRRITAYDVASEAVTGSIEIPVETFCCTGNGEVYLGGVTTDGRVVWSVDRTSFGWRPGEPDAVPADMPDHQPAVEKWPGGLMWQHVGRNVYQHEGVLATMADNGTVRRVGRVPTDQGGEWSPDGTSYAYPGQEDGRSLAKANLGHVWVHDVDSGVRRHLDLPTELPFSLVAWESRSAVILETRLPFDGVDDEHAGLQGLVRCHPATGDCEQVAGAPAGVPVLPH